MQGLLKVSFSVSQLGAYLFPHVCIYGYYSLFGTTGPKVATSDAAAMLGDNQALKMAASGAFPM